LDAKARAQANKMHKLDAAFETTLALSFAALNAELRSFGGAKGVKLRYLQDQYKSRTILRNGVYPTIPTPSEYRSTSKPYKLRMQPHPKPGGKTTTNDCIAYLLTLLRLMMLEDEQRTLQPTVMPDDVTVVRRLPIVSERYINPLSVRLKREQETRVAAMAAPKDNPWLVKLLAEYVGAILYDGGYFRVFDVLYVPNKGSKTRYPCWEATCEPVHFEAGAWVVHDRYLSIGISLSPIITLSVAITVTQNMTRTLTLTYTRCRRQQNLAQVRHGRLRPCRVF
jgi:hypothetical protein